MPRRRKGGRVFAIGGTPGGGMKLVAISRRSRRFTNLRAHNSSSNDLCEWAIRRIDHQETSRTHSTISNSQASADRGAPIVPRRLSRGSAYYHYLINNDFIIFFFCYSFSCDLIFSFRKNL